MDVSINPLFNGSDIKQVWDFSFHESAKIFDTPMTKHFGKPFHQNWVGIASALSMVF
jgi:hypothetical protein